MGIKKKAQMNVEHIKEYLLDFGFLIYERDDDNDRSSKNARNKSNHHYMFGGVSYAE